MKKKLLVLLSILSILCTLCLTGCMKPKEKMEGTYKFDTMRYTEGGVSIELKVGQTFMEVFTLTEDFVIVELKEDGTALVRISSEELEEEGTWEKVEGGVRLAFDEEPETWECDGTTLKMEQEEALIILKKQK